MNTTSLTKIQRELVAVTEERDRLAAELQKLQEQKPVAYEDYWKSDGTGIVRRQPSNGRPLFAAPVATPAVCKAHETECSTCKNDISKCVSVFKPAPAVPDGDDFNGTTPHLIQCMEALVRLDADGVLVPHGIGRSASRLLSAAANRLRQQSAPSVPEGCAIVSRTLTPEAWKRLCNADIWPVTPKSFQRMLDVLMEVALLQSAEGRCSQTHNEVRHD